MLPPRWSYLNELWRPLWDTLKIATLGTLLAILVAVPVAFLAARNTTPSAAVRAARRAAHHRLVALDQLADLGRCCWSRCSAPACSPASWRSRCARSASSASCSTRRSRRSTRRRSRRSRPPGASPAQVIDYGIVPQIMPAFAGISGVPLGHQHPRIRRCWAWSAPAASGSTRGVAVDAGLDAGEPDPARHPVAPCW